MLRGITKNESDYVRAEGYAVLVRNAVFLFVHRAVSEVYPLLDGVNLVIELAYAV